MLADTTQHTNKSKRFVQDMDCCQWPESKANQLCNRLSINNIQCHDYAISEAPCHAQTRQCFAPTFVIHALRLWSHCFSGSACIQHSEWTHYRLECPSLGIISQLGLLPFRRRRLRCMLTYVSEGKITTHTPTTAWLRRVPAHAEAPHRLLAIGARP